jgi:hypothetical protein
MPESAALGNSGNRKFRRNIAVARDLAKDNFFEEYNFVA